MLSKKQISIINSLANKKHRQKHKMFVVEGKKSVLEFINSDFELLNLFGLSSIEEHFKKYDFEIVTDKQLNSISQLKNHQSVLAIFMIKTFDEIKPDSSLEIVLDNIQDPGNLGTIIRLCDWFNIKNIYCSKKTVDCYNPKVVQATMGSLTRVNLIYLDLNEFLKSSGKKIYGAFINEKSVYKEKLINDCLLVLGNEANGISDEISEIITDKISIPKLDNSVKTESLNVAIATSILVNEFKRGF